MLANLVQPLNAPYVRLTSSTSRGPLASFRARHRAAHDEKEAKGKVRASASLVRRLPCIQKCTQSLTAVVCTHADLRSELSTVLGAI